eukprot:CAMPEP_0206141580 /NCGR_PEP_ID=MMETSP1473-20131121/13441_1 /ASSEMBLY_ACC=CAM_ASM_001109 /TAXON_ID=1461547 /ORGANISM="Stichococcus sp, Strain RCC1054" /LENGTH=154 /DNA_ID=CAMNT_0053536203 /DNA_START=125 /DNA_END=585 /DNA_ORIENTATION=+
MAIAPQPNVLWALRQELHGLVKQLPDTLGSHVPDLMIDYLATVFTDDDIQPVAREAPKHEDDGDGGTWELLGELRREDPDSAAAQAQIAAAHAAAKSLRETSAALRRLEIVPLRSLGHLAAPPTRVSNQQGSALVKCNVCKRLMLSHIGAGHKT